MPSIPTIDVSTSAAIPRMRAWSIMPQRLRGSRPRKMLRAIVIEPTSAASWKIVSIPSAADSLRSRISTSSPSHRSVPASGLTTPDITLTRVDLPAPLSPRRPTISARPTEKLTSVSALTFP
jgi:hypothetical protein